LSFVIMLLLATVLYAASYVQGWVSSAAHKTAVNPACNVAASPRTFTPPDVAINVYNTTPREGLAAAVAKSLRNQGFHLANTGNDPMSAWIQDVALIRHGRAGAGGALLAMRWLPGAKITQDDRTDATVDVVLGTKFTAVSSPPKGQRSIVVRMRPGC
jgi:hypothetical protein